MKFFRSSRVPGELRAAKVGFAELQRVDHRAHGTVEHQNALSEQFFQEGTRLGLGDDRHAVG